MKKVFSLLLVVVMVFAMGSAVMAASTNTLTYHLTSNDLYERTVPTGTIVTVAFTVENDNGQGINLTQLQNEIYYDHNFFEFVPESISIEKGNAGINSSLQIYSTNEHRVYVNSISPTEYAAKELVVTFKLKVMEDEIGARSTIETKRQAASDSTGSIETINELNLTIIIGESVSEDRKHTITYVDGDKELYSDTVIEGNVTNLRPAIEKEGFLFAGWKIGDEILPAGSNYTVGKSVTAEAQWTAVAVEKFVLSFDTNGGKSVNAVQGNKGETIRLTQTTTKDGYTFDGWYADADLTQKVTEVVMLDNTTVYAKWVKDPDNHHPDILITEHVSYIIGRDGGRIAPQDNITRAEVATIFFRLLTEEVRNENYTKNNNFKDSNSDDWFNSAVSTLANLGIVNGRTVDTYAPNDFITRAEFTTIAARFSDASWNGEDLFYDISDHWARNYINAAASIGWIVGDQGKFRPEDNITRAEVMTLVNRMLNRQPESQADLLKGMTTWVDNADTSAWYYLAVQEATNSHDYVMKSDGIHEKWTKLTKNPDWTALEK